MTETEFERAIYRRRIEDLEAQVLRLIAMLEKEQNRSIRLMDKLSQ